MDNLTDYLSRISPALAVVALVFVLVRPGKHLRVVLYILTFILLRDALTPASLWRLGVTGGVPWIRLFPSRVFLAGMALASLAAVGLLIRFDPENSREVVFLRKGEGLKGWLSALAALAVLLAPFVVLYGRIDLEDRGGAVDPAFLAPLLLFAVAGNLLEELLFRGYVGTPLLLFTLWEGVLCGIIGARYGVLPSTLVHGGAIFALPSGLL